MFYINKTTSNSTVDFAAEELKKYIRMMQPDAGDVVISYAPDAKDGFRLGLMQDFGLDTSDVYDTELDDIIYIDADAKGGILAGDNPRSVLFAVYDFLKKNGCRWLFPGVDGEFIPTKELESVKYRHVPSCRYRGQCNEGAETQTAMMETIDFTAKMCMNTYMLEFKIPRSYYSRYYNHPHNEENRPPEPLSDMQILQWKRACEAEIAKRGLQFHDIGHGFTVDPFGIDSSTSWEQIDDSSIPEETRQYLAEVNGKRGLFNQRSLCTNFCMSNAKARKIATDYIVDYASSHSNITYLHVWLSDAHNNHCECENCRKKTPSDWYMVWMNELDRALSEKKLSTRIVFICYVDTTWAPLAEKIDNPDRFTMLFAPIFRSYAETLPEKIPEDLKAEPFVLNNLNQPRSLYHSLLYLDEWKKSWKGACFAYEYHFWRHMTYDTAGLAMSKRVHEDIKCYEKRGINGVIEDGSQRAFFPNGLEFYVYAKTLYDTSLSYDEIVEEYYSALYGDDWREVYEYLTEIENIIPFEYVSYEQSNRREEGYYSEEVASRIENELPAVLEKGRAYIEKHYNSDFRVRTVAVRLLEFHALYTSLMAKVYFEAAKCNREAAIELFQKTRIEIGKKEVEFERYFDHDLYFRSLNVVIKSIKNRTNELSTF